MHFVDRFNNMISEIERLVAEFDEEKDAYYDANEIVEMLAKQEGRTSRSLNAFFEYLTGTTLNKYVKDRKWMVIYKDLMLDQDYDVQSYIEFVKSENESSFITSFGKKFGMTPKEAYRKKDKAKLEEPLSIDSIVFSPEQREKSICKSDKIFGLPKKIIDRYNEICEYQALFGLEDKYVELAVFLNEEKGLDLQDAFKTVETLIQDYEDISEMSSYQAMVYYIDREVPAVYIKHLYPDVCLPELNNWCFCMRKEGGDATKETPEFVRAFINDASDGFSYTELKELYKDYLNKNTSGSDGFIGYLLQVQSWGSYDAFDEFVNEVMNENGGCY